MIIAVMQNLHKHCAKLVKWPHPQPFSTSREGNIKGRMNFMNRALVVLLIVPCVALLYVWNIVRQKRY